MTELDLLEFTHKYREVRGFAPNRLHITLTEWREMMVSQRYVLAMEWDNGIQYDGARVIKCWHDDVVAAIRAWDLMPYGSEP